MIINGIVITSEFHLETVIADMSEETKIGFRHLFHGTSPSEPTQKEKDYAKYLRRAQVKDQLLAEMAAENMERVRNSTWTVSNLINLTQDPGLKLVLDDINTLSFELAQAKLNALAHPLLTSDIKLSWVTKLQNNLFNS
jgi:hypothetical protein